MKKCIYLLCLTLAGTAAAAQQPDTVKITAADVKPAVLQEGTHRYLVYFKMKKNATRTQTQFWTRTIERGDYNGRKAITIVQEWEDKDTIMHRTKSVCDAATMQPLYHDSWWKQRTSGTWDFVAQTAVLGGQPLSSSDTARQRKKIWEGFAAACSSYALNWHLDLEVFPILPYKKGVTFLIPFYEAGYMAPEMVAYTVAGSAQLTGYNGQEIDCWLLQHESKGNKELFWISKKTKEVLKLEQEINGTMYRYKIKLGFSI